jgi:hypothetical protein
VGDDVGIGRTTIGSNGRSGIAGTVLVLKIAGALAASGYDFLPLCILGVNCVPGHRWKRSRRLPN